MPENSADYSLYAARNEYESFQIVISSGEKPLKIENIVFSDFAGGDAAISNKNIFVYREHYIEFKRNSPRSGMLVQELPGLLPDALIPAQHPVSGEPLKGARFSAFPFEMRQNDVQPYFIDVKIPYDASPGDYFATYTVITDAGNISGTVSLRVWNIALPKKQVQRSFFGSWSNVSREKAEEAAKNRIFIKTTDKEHQKYLYENYGYNTCNIGFWSGADIDNPQMREAPTAAQVEEKLAGCYEKLDRFSYSADEIGHRKELFPRLIEWGRAMHKAGARHLVVMPPKRELFDDGLGEKRSAVDIWVVLPKQYIKYKKVIDEAVAKGDSIWTYNCLVQDEYSPKWLLDYSLLGFRLQPGFINYSLKSEGFLFWVVDNYGALKDPWNCLNEKLDGDVWNGDGRLFYPGEDVGLPGSFVPSLRVKAIRDGFEDYELCHIISALGKDALAAHYSEIIGKDFENYSEEPEILLENRIKMGNAFRGGKGE